MQIKRYIMDENNKIMTNKEFLKSVVVYWNTI